MSADHIRRCPSCSAENAPQVMRCICGALLAGVDLVSRQAAESASALAAGTVAATAPVSEGSVACPYEDCGQRNPAGADTCLYCNRALANDASLSRSAQLQSLVSLPGALKKQYRIVKPLPVQGGEAELLLVEDFSGGPARVAKIYRHGIQPRPDVQQRIARIDLQHRVDVLAFGVSDGHAYELMEFCIHGSLRKYMHGPLAPDLLLVLVREIASALAGVHAVGLLHRDLKPENILVRTGQPLDLVLTDFGIASVLDATQRFTGTARTLPYAAPESLSGVIDGKADFWALGMIILEGALGKHPFHGLSEAVILHHLTTRSIDLGAVTDRKLRKLLRGLLLRDPKTRWGSDEITRWLANDASLAEPAEQGIGSGFKEPYHIASEVCHTMEQLAVALARNWREGVADMANGLLLAWFRDVQKDQNAVRLLLELRHDSRLAVDLQLLKLILHLAPGIPPVWRGETVELPAILAHANLALKGDAEAALWLDRLYQYRVLETYAAAGNQECGSIVQKWNMACDQFAAAWDAGLALISEKAPAHAPGEYVNFDRLVYGSRESVRPQMADMHARLLAIAYDPQWAERLRRRLTAELTSVVVHCPWLVDLGSTQSLGAASLLVLESLLPEAKKAAQRQVEAGERQRVSDTDESTTLKGELRTALGAIHDAGEGSLLTAAACARLRAALDRYFALLSRIRSSGRIDLPWQEIRKSASRAERAAGQMVLLVDTLAEQRAEIAGWMSREVLVFFVLAMVLLPIFFGQQAAYLVSATAGALLVWRVAPCFSMVRRIRELARKL